jgi:hypothetical protein
MKAVIVVMPFCDYCHFEGLTSGWCQVDERICSARHISALAHCIAINEREEETVMASSGERYILRIDSYEGDSTSRKQQNWAVGNHGAQDFELDDGVALGAVAGSQIKYLEVTLT